MVLSGHKSVGLPLQNVELRGCGPADCFVQRPGQFVEEYVPSFRAGSTSFFTYWMPMHAALNQVGVMYMGAMV